MVQTRSRGLLRNFHWQQDGTPPDRTAENLSLLKSHFRDRITAEGFPERSGCGPSWPPYSPDLSTGDYLLWGLKIEFTRRTPIPVIPVSCAPFWGLTLFSGDFNPLLWGLTLFSGDFNPFLWELTLFSGDFDPRNDELRERILEVACELDESICARAISSLERRVRLLLPQVDWHIECVCI